MKISNETHRVVSYFKVTVEKGEMFLLFDLQPESITTLLVHPQTDQRMDYSWLSGGGKFDDGKVIPEYGLNFKVRDAYQGPAHYCMTIKDEGLIINSAEFEGFKYDKSGVEIKATVAGKRVSDRLCKWE